MFIMTLIFQHAKLFLMLVLCCCYVGVVEARNLAVGDFDELNELLEGAFIKLPDATVSTDRITVEMTNVRCTNFRVDDVLVDATQSPDAAGETTLRVAIEGLDMVCFTDYRYTFLFTRSGQADLYSFDNRASVSMVFHSPNYDDGGNLNPTQSHVETCDPDVSVNDMNFRGSIAAIVLSIVEGLLRDQVEAEAEKRICEELRALSQSLVTEVLQDVDETLDEYIVTRPPDPLRSEQTLSLPANISIVDFQDREENTWKHWLHRMLGDAVTFLTKQVDDSIFGSNMNVNVLIRDNFLDSDRAFTIDVSRLLNKGQLDIPGVGKEFILYQGHDKFLQPTILLDSIKIYGLDTFTSFEPLVDIGKHTLQTEVSFRYLIVELEITMDVKPSTRQDSIFVNPDVNRGIVEKVKIKFGVEDLQALASVLLAVDEEQLGWVSIGSLLDTDQILPCFISTLFRLQVSGLSVEVSDMEPPSLRGFVSAGIDRVVSNSVDAAFLMYKDAILAAAPGFFGGQKEITVAEFLNAQLDGSLSAGFAEIGGQCNPPDISVSDNGFVDFRDLLLDPTEAKAAGALGTQPYGDVVYSVVTAAKEQFFGNDTDGSPKINSLIRDFLAENPNGVAMSTEDVFNTTANVVLGGFQASVDFHIFDAHVENLDTIGSPLLFFEPVVGEANMLNNSVSIGADSKPVRLSAKILISVSDGAGLHLRNELGVSLDLTSARIEILLLLQILEKQFFAVPLRDTLNLNCWLTTVLPTAREAPAIAVKHHAMSVEDLSLDIACLSCSSPNLDALIDMLYSEDTKKKVVNFLDLVLESDYLRIATEGFVDTASKQCPHIQQYDPDSSWGDFVKDAFGGFGILEATRDEKAVYFNVAIAVITVCLIIAFIVVKWVARRRNRALMKSLPNEITSRLQIKGEVEKKRQAELNEETQSMFRSPQLPRHVRLIVPLALLLTVGLVLVGHLGVLSTVNVVGQFAGEAFAMTNVLEFSFISAALRTYSNGGIEVAILLFLFTGVWLAKLLTSIALWFIPPRKLSVSRRGTVLLWLDVFAKLSLPDIFMMLLAIGAIMVFIGGVDGTIPLDEVFFSAKLIVVPGPGFYCIIMGQRITRVISRYLLECHLRIVDSAGSLELMQCDKELGHTTGHTVLGSSLADDDEVVEPEARTGCDKQEACVDGNQVCAGPNPIVERAAAETRGDEPEFQTVHTSHNEDQSLARLVAILIIGLTLVILIVIACVFAPAISVDTRVVIGLLGSGKTFEQVVKEYGMFWILSRILVQSRFVLDSTEDYIGLGFLLVLVVVTSCAAPVMKAFSFIRRWIHRRRMHPNRTAAKPKGRRRDAMCDRTKFSVALRRWFRWEKTEKDSDYLPACRLKAWKDLEVYIVAFCVAMWQLGAVAGYAIHLFCYLLEMVFDVVVYLGLMEKTSPQCWKIQARSPSFVSIVFMSFFVLLASFLLQAANQYSKTMRQATEEWKEVEDNVVQSGEDCTKHSRHQERHIDRSCSKEESTRTDVTEVMSSSSF